jgi:hypothetical protein
MKEKEIIDICPVKQIEDNKMVNGTLDITIGFSLVLPEVFTMSNEDALVMENTFDSIIRGLPEGSILHKQDLFYVSSYKNDDNIDNEIHRSTVDMFNERKMLSHRSLLFITFPDRYFIKKPKDTSQVFNSVPMFKNIFKNITEERFQKIEDNSKSILNLLNNIKFCTATRMGDYELAASLYDYLNQSYAHPTAADASIEDKVISPIGFDKKKGLLMVGDKYVSVVSLKREGRVMYTMKQARIFQPDSYQTNIKFSDQIKKNASLSYPLGIGFAVNHILNTVIQIVDNGKVLAALESEKKVLDPFASVLGHSKAKQKIFDIIRFKDSIEKTDEQCCLCHVDLVIQADDVESLVTYNDIAQKHFEFMNESVAVVENFESEALFLLDCPGNVNWNYRTIKTVTRNAVMYLHKETHYLNDAEGMLLADRYGTPLNISFRGSANKGSHKVIYGPTGTGKSFFLNEYINQALYRGTHVVVIDVGRSYQRLCAFHKGIFFDSGNSDLMSFNIFVCKQDALGNYLYIDTSAENEDQEQQINFVVSCIELLLKGKKGTVKMENAIIKKTVVGYYEYVNENKLFPDFNGYYDWALNVYTQSEDFTKRNFGNYIDMTVFSVVLEDYTEGKTYGKLLNSKSNIDLVDAKLVIFDAEAILKNKVIFPLYCMIVMQLFQNKISRLPLSQPKELINDEALDFLMDEQMGSFLGYQYRTARKKGAAIGLATQSVAFMKGLPQLVRDSITVNTSVYILLNHKGYENLYPVMKEVHSFTDNDLELLGSLENGEGYREIFIKLDGKSRVYRVGLSAMARLAYSTTPVEVDVINRLYKETGNYSAAIMQYLENIKNQKKEKV